jgi:CMP-N-acetylneuraminic acid synthetase
MRTAIVVPAKGTSTRVKNKNLYKIKGKTLVRRACEKILDCKAIEGKYLDTEDQGIMQDCTDLTSRGLQILRRPVELANNFIGANELIAFALHSIPHCELLLQTFSTSPTIGAATIDRCIEHFLSNRKDEDSFLTVISMQEYFWNNKNEPINFDLQILPNSFELEPIFMETHGLYGIFTETFLKKKTRIGYKPMLIEIPKLEAFDIDTAEDIEIVERLVD